MKKQKSILYHIIIFTLAQLAWFIFLGLWLYWYISNYILITEAGELLSAQILSEITGVGGLVSGILLLVAISVGMSMIFIYLTRQMSITRFYDMFIANVTHELKSPLSSIQLHLETLYQRELTPEKRYEFINMMLGDAARLNDLITSILDISGLDQKKLAFDFQVSDAQEVFSTLISEAIQEFNISQGNTSRTGQLNGNVVIDRRAMKIAINNLIDNALKYSKNDPNVEPVLSMTAKKFIIEISDHGIGFSNKDQKNLFKKFQRIYNSESPSVKGTGLGLYWVREIVQAHGGKVAAFSSGPNRGATFRIELPVYQVSKKRYINRLLKLTQRRKKSTNSNDDQTDY